MHSTSIMRAAYPILLLLLSLGSAHAGGFGQLGWGTTFEQARKKLPRLRRVEVGPASLERTALRAIAADASKRKKRALKPSKPRILVARYVVQIEGLRAQIELHYLANRLYGAVLRTLYSEAQKPAAARIMDLLAKKYGAPKLNHGQRVEFDTGDGDLVVHTKPATPARRGMLRLAYRGKRLGKSAQRYLDDLQFRSEAKVRRKAAAKEAAAVKKERNSLDHL